ncbi:ATP-binding protein [Aureimonas sp. ME7]|uniref:ATP-binding protein n=1 Tax=Aureimonas sp. ME7 TaxID=2744252 RepID=UPI0015F71B57|nr:ATP-binding protein [Aureimonas sp. ME7]
MMSLRTRLIGLLVVAIVAVVVLAAGATLLVMDGPDDGARARSAAEHVRAVNWLVDGSVQRARAAGLIVAARPSAAAIDADYTQELIDALRAAGSTLTLLVEASGGRTRQVAFPVTETEWARLSLPSAPPSPLLPLLSYGLLVILGATAIAVPIAARILRPVRLMERIIASVRADGTLAPIDDRGTPEERSIARSFNALSARVSAAYEGRIRVIAAAGHDLRTPMTRLRLRAEFLPESDRIAWLRDLAELDAIADSAIRLVREETDPSAFERVALREMIETIVGELEDIGLPAVTVDPIDFFVEAQPLALKRALRNVVENAARHGGGARVAVEAEEGMVAIVVEDDGPGIPARLMDRVFEPFFSVDQARQKKTGGAGLGLAIAKEIVERQGGRIALSNRTAGGLRQEVRLPASTA